MNRNIIHKWNVVKDELRNYGYKFSLSKIEEIQDKYDESEIKIHLLRKVVRKQLARR